VKTARLPVVGGYILRPQPNERGDIFYDEEIEFIHLSGSLYCVGTLPLYDNAVTFLDTVELRKHPTGIMYVYRVVRPSVWRTQLFSVHCDPASDQRYRQFFADCAALGTIIDQSATMGGVAYRTHHTKTLSSLFFQAEKHGFVEAVPYRFPSESSRRQAVVSR